MRLSSRLLLAALLTVIAGGSAANFKVEGISFLLDGKPFQIRSGEIHFSQSAQGKWV